MNEIGKVIKMNETGEVIKGCPRCGSNYLEVKTNLKERGVQIICMSCGEIIMDTNSNTTRCFHRGDVVLHFKGRYYEIIYPYATCCTNGKESKVVIYRPFNSVKNTIYVRDYDEFMSEVDFTKCPNSEQKYRFEYAFNIDNSTFDKG